jgi:energy-coupling factor transport system permease protein
VITDRVELSDDQLDSPLGRTSPVVKLAIAFGWLAGLALTLHPLPPLILAGAALTAGLLVGGIPPSALARGLAPLWIAALGVAVFNIVFSASNADPSSETLFSLGPLRISVEAAVNGLALGLRVVAIAAVGAVFTLTTDSTRLADSLVQQVHLSPRFAYGALAAYQAIPRFAEDLTALRQARRIRGLRGGWHPRLLVGVLILAIRHGDRMALSMDTRGFGSGPRTFYRRVRWSPLDALVGVDALLILVAALALAG